MHELHPILGSPQYRCRIVGDHAAMMIEYRSTSYRTYILCQRASCRARIIVGCNCSGLLDPQCYDPGSVHHH